MKTRTFFATALAAVVMLAPFAAFAQDAKPAEPAPEAKPKGGRQAAAFTAADKDGDGRLNLAEFTDFAKVRMDADAAKAKFAELDANKDGFVSKEELRSGMRGQGRKGAEEKKPADGEKKADSPEKKSE